MAGGFCAGLRAQYAVPGHIARDNPHVGSQRSRDAGRQAGVNAIDECTLADWAGVDLARHRVDEGRDWALSHGLLPGLHGVLPLLQGVLPLFQGALDLAGDAGGLVLLALLLLVWRPLFTRRILRTGDRSECDDGARAHRSEHGASGATLQHEVIPSICFARP